MALVFAKHFTARKRFPIQIPHQNVAQRSSKTNKKNNPSSNVAVRTRAHKTNERHEFGIAQPGQSK